MVLADGTELIVKRYASYRISRKIAGPTSAFIKESRLQIEKGNNPIAEWRTNLEPLLLERDPSTSDLVIVATTDYESVFLSRGHPTPSYWQFRYRSGRWIQDPSLSAFVLDKKSNLLMWSFWIDDRKDLITTLQKNQWAT